MDGQENEVYPTETQKSLINAAEKCMEEIMARYDPSHDAYHVNRVRKTALVIAHSKHVSALKPDLLVVELAAIFHDLLDRKYVSEKTDPHVFISHLFTSLPMEPYSNSITAGQIQLIARIIDNVSWSSEKKLIENGEITDWHRSCVELHCVQDADRLDAIGAFGVMRCAAFSAVTNRPLYVPSDDPRSNETAIAHFHDKLFHIRERLKTEPGKKLAEQRHQLMVDFVIAIEAEAEAVL